MNKNKILNTIIFVLVVALFLELIGVIPSPLELITQKKFEGMQTMVTDKSMIISIVIDGRKAEIDGKFTGEVRDGMPDGEGTFTYEKNGSIVLKYSGSFEQGAITGYGILSFHNDDDICELESDFIDGKYTPTVTQLFQHVGRNADLGKFELTDQIHSFIDANSELFPSCSAQVLQSFPIQSFSNKEFKKTRRQNPIGLIKQELLVIQIFEDELFDTQLTQILASDGELNRYALYYLGSTKLVEGDHFTAFSIPVGTSSFSNIGGGTTLVTVLLSCNLQ